ncbi:MAG: UDP-N-acetylmuramoyl-tripeptide--D-alanyl-D-alanine ligase, partial [Clostridia bacterium]|nr:UDP-N-acetylmuramoyl-tripeptide--D-alanyl-D-alanine ligase [Clostridia bacterium]
MRVTLSKPFSDTKRLTKALGATLISGELPPVLRGIATDSREVRRGDLFVALHGQRVEGSEYLEQARRQGALALLVPQGTPIPADIACLTVDDTEAALLRAARERRHQAKAFVIAVSGSCGKTTVKEATATLLASRGRTERSRANFNSQIGMPLSLLSMEDCAHWVLELGINHIGEMEKMAA